MKAEYVDHMGNDLNVVNAARVSFDKVSEYIVPEKNSIPECSCGRTDYCPCAGDVDKELPSEDERLIKYLARHNHWTPFAHTAITLRMTAPIPIRTQCFKHKAGFVENEVSRRYVSSEPEFYVPVLRQAAENKKQGSGEDMKGQAYWTSHYRSWMNQAIGNYLSLIDNGVCEEQARFVLPQGVLTEWIWTGNLASYARFCKQRLDPHAQKEIQELAKMVSEIIEPLFPVSWAALMEN